VAVPEGTIIDRLLARLGRPPRSAAPGRDPLGPAGEKLAARHLKRSGYRVIGCNLRVPMGEADVLAIAPDERTIVLVEVKTRRTPDSPGAFTSPPPEASITAHKREKLVTILRHLARANGWAGRSLRIDAIAIEWPSRGEPVLRHHERAISMD
jgi:putative endonuclease